MIATDHESVDGTTEILRSYERQGRLTLLHEQGEIRQGDWVTRMARLAATEQGADWVINSDADEFWLPRHGSLQETFAAVPAPFGVVRALMRHFVPRPETAGHVLERMVVRHPGEPVVTSLYHSQVKVAHRACPDVLVPRGNHDAYGEGLRLLRAWFPLEVLHFPVRSLDQMQRKFSRRGDSPAFFVQSIRREIAADGADVVFGRYAVDGERLRAAVESGALAVDVRLRNLLAGDSKAGVPMPPESAVEAEHAFVADIASFMETDSGNRLHPRVDELERRLLALPPSPAAGVLTRPARRVAALLAACLDR